MSSAARLITGTGFFARVARGTSWTVLGFGIMQVLRLAANLILTRILFPDAFGLMALVTVFITGLTMFSDMGLGQSIMQNKRGDDQDFLDTAWTMQIIRGLILWLGTCLVALPAAKFYGEPMLGQLLPVVGLSLLIGGLNPTRMYTSNRHLLLGRVTALELINQVISLVILVGLAWATRSVWALAIGAVISAITHVVLAHVILPGQPNRLRWEDGAVADLIHFGKWIFVSSGVGFLIHQGDKAILGAYLTLEMFGIYSIGYFIASFPILLGGAIVGRILIPLYRDKSPTISRENFRKVRHFRVAMTATLMSLLVSLAFLGVSLVDILYDPRYAAAGAVVVLVACAHLAQVIWITYDQSALAAGDSRGFCITNAIRAVLQLALFVTGMNLGGTVGAIAGQGLAQILIYPAIVWLARRHGVWDPLHDAIFAVIGLTGGGLAVWWNWEAITGFA